MPENTKTTARSRACRPAARTAAAVLYAAVLAAAIGCESPPKPSPDQHAEYNQAMIQWMNNAAIDNAIIAQHTLYPYHFVANSAELNDLGRRDAMVLANHYRLHPGVVNVRRAGTPTNLYNARLDTVRQALSYGGVDLSRVQITDGFPGGDGATSERVVEILDSNRPPTDAFVAE